MLKLKNTLTGKLEEFKPIKEGEVGMYNCGPTVYSDVHIGNLRSFLLADILRRVLEYNGYSVNQIMNITDVGHLSDEAGDRVEEAAKKEKKSSKEIAEFYTRRFFNDLKRLNIDLEKIVFPKASEHINEQIELIIKLEKKGFTYKTSDGIYFDTSKFSEYGKLGNIKIDELKEGARVEKNNEKKNPTDFALWKFSNPKEKRHQEWDSPWGVGFPGWHIECSAMSMKYLGETFDIHTGGVDLASIHHNNEIAQSENATEKPFVNYWLHNAFLNIKGDKISKSEGNIVILDEIVQRGINPLSYRYWLLTANYSSPINFTWESLEGVETALNKLYERFRELSHKVTKLGKADENYKAMFKGFINDDLNTPKAIALMWELLKDVNVSNDIKKSTLLDFDKVLGLGLGDVLDIQIPKEVQYLADERERARKDGNWDEADRLREKILKLGFEIKDTPEGPKYLHITAKS